MRVKALATALAFAALALASCGSDSPSTGATVTFVNEMDGTSTQLPIDEALDAVDQELGFRPPLLSADVIAPLAPTTVSIRMSPGLIRPVRRADVDFTDPDLPGARLQLQTWDYRTREAPNVGDLPERTEAAKGVTVYHRPNHYAFRYDGFLYVLAIDDVPDYLTPDVVLRAIDDLIDS